MIKPEEYVSSDTALFILKLRCSNLLWYNYVVRCAQVDAKTVRRCIQQVPNQFPNEGYAIKDVSPFEICRAVNEGHLTEDAYGPAWKTKTSNIATKIYNHFRTGMPLWFT